MLFNEKIPEILDLWQWEECEKEKEQYQLQELFILLNLHSP